MKGLLPSLQTAVAQTTSNISAVQTSLQKLNELLSQDRDWSAPVDHTVARCSTIGEGSRSIQEHATEANRQITHNTRDITFSKADTQQSQSTDRHNPQVPVPQVNTYTVRRRTKSDSAGTRNTAWLIKEHRVISDKSPHHDTSDPHLVHAVISSKEKRANSNNTKQPVDNATVAALKINNSLL